MKGAVLALFCAVALASAEINENGCPINPYVDILIPHPNCNKYYQCVQGGLFERQCASTTVFNVEIQECDWPENVDCGDRNPVVPVSSEEADNDSNSNGQDNGNEDSGSDSDSGNENGDNNNNGAGGNGNPSEAAEICAAEGSDGVLVSHEDCNQFYKCSEGIPVALKCYGNLLFNPATDQCDWPENVICEDRNTDSGNDGSGDNGNGGNDNDNNVGGGNGNPSEAGEICAAEGSDGVLVAHEDCSQFYKCSEGVPVALRCYGNLLFNPATDQCDWPENVNCEDRNTEGDNGNGDNGSGENENGDNNNNNNGGGGNSNPSEAGEICAAEGSDGVLVAHEDCSQFYKCSEGVPVSMNCFGNLLFNPANDQCDWPENVKCEDRNTNSGNDGNGENENGDNNNNNNGGGGNSNPSEAGEICAAEGSDGVLVAHEDCSQFYKCSEGVPVSMNCFGNLLFNPANDQCDWPENVNCEDRNMNSGNDGNGDNGNGDNDNDNNGGGGNGNPSEAAEICAAEGSDGVLVAHEDCSQFYKCSEGVPVAMNCFGNLLFNPATDQCDWPENVNCESRNTDNENNGIADNGNVGSGNGDNVIGDTNIGNNGGSGNGNPSEASGICAAQGSDGVLVAHENCDQFYKCSEGVPVALSCFGNLLFNPATDQCDWPENVNCEDRSTDSGNDGNEDNGNGDNGNGDDNDNNGGGGNGNPSEAGEICAAEGSDGVLVAHEDCSQFYKCSEGVPVAMNCFGNLLFNPENDQCDWPENVNCGSRIRFTSFNKHLRFRM